MESFQTQQIFSKLAKQYDTEDRIKIAKIIANTIQNYIIDGKNKNALDYGCGTGLVGLNLTDYFNSMLFVDSSVNMIEQVQHKININNIQNAKTLCMDFTLEIPFLKVDYILLSQVLLHIKNTEQILSQLFKLLNDDGHLIIVDFNKEESINSDLVHNGFEQSELITLVKEIGFSSVDSNTFHHGKKIFMNHDASLFILEAIK